MKRKVVFAALAASTLLLAGCGGGGFTSDGEGSNSGGGKKETFTLQIFAGGYGTKPWSTALKLFEKDHPEYNVVVNMDNNVNEQFANKWKQGNPPDFVFLDGTLDKETWLKEGLLEDLSDWKAEAKVAGEDVKIADKVNDAYWVKYTDSSNKTITYGAPLILNAYGMWYDQALFAEKGFTMPKNYEELKSFAGLATKDLKTLIYPGIYSGYLTQGLLVPAFAELGESFFSRIMNCTDVDVYRSAEFKSVIQRFSDFVSLNDNVVADCISDNHTTSQTKWLNHQASLIPNGFWLRSEMAKLNAIPEGFEMCFAPSPLVKEQQYIVSSSVACGVASEAKNKKAAKEFMTYLYRDDVQREFAYASDSPVVTNVTLEEDKVSPVLIDSLAVFNDPKYKHMTNSGSWGGVDKAINDVVNSLVAKSISVDQAITQIANAADANLKNK